MANILAMIIPAIIGSVIMVNGVLMNSDDIIASAHVAANQMNIHQLDNALEIYYSDHGEYPAVEGGEALTELLVDDGYIRSQPFQPEKIVYEPTTGNQNYSLSLVK